jgi:hypothetical protein
MFSGKQRLEQTSTFRPQRRSDCLLFAPRHPGAFTTAGTAAVLNGNLNVSGPSGILNADVVAVEGGNINVLGGGRVETNLLGSIGGEINVAGSGSRVNAELTDISGS